jgi:ADP-ribose pyrophosphatase YjhB (NUDIX family)
MRLYQNRTMLVVCCAAIGYFFHAHVPEETALMSHIEPRFCSQCGSAQIVNRIPDGDDHPRDVCGACGHIHYFNPKIVVGALPIWEEKILLCKRAIEPRYGKWTLPAGFMEEQETLEEGALRETLEEAGARIVLTGLYTVISLPDISQVYMLYRANLSDLDFAPGRESLEARLFAADEIPWDELAFRTISLTLKHYLADRASGFFPVRNEILRHPARGVAG